MEKPDGRGGPEKHAHGKSTPSSCSRSHSHHGASIPKPTGWGRHKHRSCLHRVQVSPRPQVRQQGKCPLSPPSLVPLQGGHRGLAAGELGMPHVPKHSSSDHTSRPSHGGCTAAHGAQSCPLQEGTARTRDTRPGSSASTSPAALALPVPSPPVEQQHSHPTFHPADIGAPVPTDRNTEARVNQPSALPLHPILG